MAYVGLRETTQRTVILDELRAICTHPTADDVYRVVKQRLPRISLATVYRNLEVLAEQGAIRRLCPSGAQRRYDANIKDHHHVRCLRCGRFDDIDGSLPCCVEDAFRGAGGYQILGHRLEIFGLCPACRAARNPPADPAAPTC